MRTSPLLQLIVCAFVAMLFASAEAQDFTAGGSVSDEMSRAMIHPLLKLPARITARPDELTLHADFEERSERGVPLYLVNRTNAPIVVQTQDGDVYAKLEQKTEEGWHRAQPHRFSWCGNSYIPLTLNPGTFLRTYGYMPAAGTPAKVRYRIYGELGAGRALISGEGPGFVLAEDIALVQADQMADPAVPTAIAEALLPRSETWRVSAPPERRVAALRLLHAYMEEPKLKKHAGRLVELCGADVKTPEMREAIGKAVEEALAAKWPGEPDPLALLQRCVAALEHRAPEKLPFGAPERVPGLAWTAVAELAQQTFGPAMALAYTGKIREGAAWRPLLAVAEAKFEKLDEESISALARLLKVQRLADEVVADGVLEKLLRRGDGSARRNGGLKSVAAEILARRGRADMLVAAGRDLPLEGKVIVLAAMAVPGKKSGPHSDVRRLSGAEADAFWAECLRRYPLQSVSALRLATSYSPEGLAAHFDISVHDAIRDYLLAEAERSEAAQSDFPAPGGFGELTGAVQELASWKRAGDQGLLRRLLKYRGYETGYFVGEPSQPRRREYPVREAAREALLAQGVSVRQSETGQLSREDAALAEIKKRGKRR